MPYVPEETLSPRRLTTVAAVVLLHVGLIVTLKNGLARQIIELIKLPINVMIIQEDVIAAQEPPPPLIKIETPPPFVPMPEISIKLPLEPPSTTAIASVVSATPLPEVPVAVVAPTNRSVSPVSRTGAKLNSSRSPSPNEYYPPTSKRLGEEGSAIVGVCIGPDGRVVGPAKLDETSGSSRLDEAALKYVARTRWTAATENGKPVQACTSLSVRFVLKDGY